MNENIKQFINCAAVGMSFLAGGFVATAIIASITMTSFNNSTDSNTTEVTKVTEATGQLISDEDLDNPDSPNYYDLDLQQEIFFRALDDDSESTLMTYLTDERNMRYGSAELLIMKVKDKLLKLSNPESIPLLFEND